MEELLYRISTDNDHLPMAAKVHGLEVSAFLNLESAHLSSRTSKTGRTYTVFGVAIISDHNLQAFHYNVVAFGEQGHFAKQLQADTRIELVVQAQSQPDNIASIPLLTATFVRPVHPVVQRQTAA